MKKGLFFCITVVLFGLLDLVTTLVGVIFFGAAEANPLLASIVVGNPLVFSVIKLFAVAVTGFTFYKAGNAKQALGGSVQLGNRFLQLTHSFMLVFLTTVVTNNLIVLAKLV